MKILPIALFIALTGCATAQQVAESSNTFASCKAADVATTAYALHTGHFIEKNPLIAPLVSHGFIPLIAISIALWYVVDRYDGPKATMAANAITCPVAGHNLWLLLQ